MKKKIGVIMILVLILSVMLVPSVYADTSSQQQKTNDTYSKMIDNQKQLIQQYEDSGQITSQQADIMRQRSDLMYSSNINTTANGSQQYGPGYGCWGNSNGSQQYGYGCWGNSNGSNGYGDSNYYSTGSRRCW